MEKMTRIPIPPSPFRSHRLCDRDGCRLVALYGCERSCGTGGGSFAFKLCRKHANPNSFRACVDEHTLRQLNHCAKTISEMESELARLRVIEKEHGEMRATLRAIVEYFPTSPGQDSILCRTQGMAAIVLSRFTQPAKAEGEGDIKVKLWGNTAAPGQPGAAP